MFHTSLRIQLALVASCLLLQPCSAIDAILIRAKHVITMTGPPLENVEVLVRNGRIIGLGDSVKPLGTYQLIEVDTLMPGLIDAYSHAGLRGGDAELTREVTPEFETATTIDWDSLDFLEAATAGTTSLNIMPSTENVICGFGALVKASGDEPSTDSENKRIINPRTGLALAVCSDPASGNSARSRPDSIYVRLPTNRMGVVWIIRNQLQKTRDVAPQDPAAMTPTDKALSAVLQGATTVFGVSRTSYDIETLLALGDEFAFKPTLIGGHEAYKTVDALAGKNVPVVYTASTGSGQVGDERTDLFWNTPGLLENAGVSVTLAGGDLLERARFAARFGMTSDGALQAITTRPAALLGAGNRIGKIAADYDADLIALDGPPLEFTTNVRWVMVDGNVLQSGSNE